MSAESIDICEIMSLIPHRYPFLLIDKITELNLNKNITGIKNVTMNEPQFTGHFPGRPIMPGVLMIEAMAQLAACLAAKSMQQKEDREIFFMSIDRTKFRKPVQPGDSLIIYAELIQQRGFVWKFKANAKVIDKIVAEAEFMAMVKSKEDKKI